MRRLITSVTLALCVCGLAVAGCGSDGATSTTQGTTTSTQETAVNEVAGLYPVSVDGKWGYIDKTGTIRVQPQFNDARDFSDGLAGVRVRVTENEVGKWGYIDTTGALVIQPQFDETGDFAEGMAAVGTCPLEEPRYGYINKSGAVVIPIQYEGLASWAPKFSHGLCVVTVEDDGPPPSVTSTSLTDMHDQNYGYIDKTGAMVIAAQFQNAWSFSEGLAAVSSETGLGFIDTSGNWVITLPPNSIPADVPSSDPSSLRSSFSFREGLAIVCEMQAPDATKPLSETNRPGRRYGYVDKTGEVVIEPQFEEARFFSERLAAVSVEEDGVMKWGYVDQKGAWVIEPRFDGAGDFSDGLAIVGFSVTGGSGPASYWRSDYIDRTGKTVISLEPGQRPYEFSGGVARVVTSGGEPDAPRSTSLYDTTSKVIWQGE